MGGLPSRGRRQSNTLAPEDPAEPAVLDDHRYMVVSLYDYPPHGPTANSISMGERLNVLSDEGDLWRVSSTSTGRESYIPSNYTAKVFNRWQYEGISREKAEQLLLLPHNQAGSFLIRESQTFSGSYSLSILQTAASSSNFVRHYHIPRLQNGWFYVQPRHAFPSLSKLVDHYSESAGGLRCLLREPCFILGSNRVPVVAGPPPMAVRKPTLNWKDMKSSTIFSTDKADTEEPLVSEGLRETMNSYLYLTEQSSYEDCCKPDK